MSEMNIQQLPSMKPISLGGAATADAGKGLGMSNWGRYSNPEVDQALERATVEFDDTRRAAILQAAAKVVSDDVGIIPLFHYQNIWAARKGLKVVPWVSDRTAAIMVTEGKP